MISKYLTDIGVKESDTPWGWLPDDKRQEVWKLDQSIYGFDNRDTWSLDYTIALLIYPRLKMYDEVNIIATDKEKIKCGVKTYTMQECIDKILKAFEDYIIYNNKGELTSEVIDEYKNAYKILSYCIRDLWW